MFSKNFDLYFRALAFLAALAAYLLSLSDPKKFRAILLVLSCLLWLYVLSSLWAELFTPVRAIKNSHLDAPRSSVKPVALMLVIWLSGLTAAYIGFRLWPWPNRFLIFTAVALLGIAEKLCSVKWCPFARFITFAACCQRCRLRHWGKAMALSPLLISPAWWTGVLVLLSLVLILKYEIVYKLHPQMYPLNIKCSDCAVCRRAE